MNGILLGLCQIAGFVSRLVESSCYSTRFYHYKKYLWPKLLLKLIKIRDTDT